jgi:hypothetical protein
MKNYEMVLYFSYKHFKITTIKADSFEEARQKAHKINDKTIIKIEPFIAREFISIKGVS